MKTRFTAVLIIAICCATIVGCGGANGSQSSDEFQQFKDIKAKADEGDTEAQCWLAICYSNGFYGCKIDKVQAQELFQKVAQQTNENLAAVQHSKGVCYKNGYGVTKDLVEAAKWYLKAAER